MFRKCIILIGLFILKTLLKNYYHKNNIDEIYTYFYLLL